MSRVAMPIDAELEEFLKAAGMISLVPTQVQELLDLPGAIGATVEDFGIRTGYVPFLADADDVTLTYDPADCRRTPKNLWLLDLDTGFVSVTSVTVNGSTWVFGTDYYLGPQSAPRMGRPWSTIEFWRQPVGRPRTISVAGKQGFGLTVPEKAFQGILAGAAAMLVPKLSAALTKGLIEWRRGDDMKKWGANGAFSSEKESWTGQYKDAIGAHFRTRVG